jgi:hypothetical protein
MFTPKNFRCFNYSVVNVEIVSVKIFGAVKNSTVNNYETT